jgi:hypothetical protein
VAHYLKASEKDETCLREALVLQIDSNNMCISQSTMSKRSLPSLSLFEHNWNNKRRNAGSVMEETAARSSPVDKELNQLLTDIAQVYYNILDICADKLLPWWCVGVGAVIRSFSKGKW